MMVTNTLERGDHVTVNHMSGVACWYTGPCDVYRLDEYDEPTDDCLHGECVIVVMVGDDVGHHVQLDNVERLARDKGWDPTWDWKLCAWDALGESCDRLVDPNEDELCEEHREQSNEEDAADTQRMIQKEKPWTH